MNLTSYYYGMESESLQLRKLTPDDADAWAVFFENNPSLPYLNIDLNRMPLEMSKAWISTQMERYTRSAFGQLGIVAKQTGVLIGTVGFLVDESCRQGEIVMAIAILPAHWGKGYALEASKLAINTVFEHSLAETIVGFRHHDNQRSASFSALLGGKDTGMYCHQGRESARFEISRATWQQKRDFYQVQSLQPIQ